MRKVNFKKITADDRLVSEKGKYFLGEVNLNDISSQLSISGQKVYYARFKRGARTKLHCHQGGQVLLVTAGLGVLVLYGRLKRNGRRVSIRQKSRIQLREGDMVFIPKGTLHWHGAFGMGNFAHIAFNGFSTKGREARTFWFDSDFRTYASEII